MYPVLSYTYVIFPLPSGWINTCFSSGVTNHDLGANCAVTRVSVVPLCVAVTVSLATPSFVPVYTCST